MWTVRRAEEKDLPDVLKIEKLSFSFPWSILSFQKELHKEYSHLWVIEEKNIIRGYLCFWCLEEEAHILKLAIDPAFRRRGMASFLLKEMFSFLLKKRVEKIFIEVRKSNEAALKFYKKLGFKIYGIRRDYYYYPKEDAYLMVFRFLDAAC